jgi:hypothetical protein
MLKSNTLNNKIPARIRHGLAHRVGRVLSFFSSRRNWDYPNPLLASECAPPPALGGGAHSLAERGVGRVPIPTRGHTLWYSLYLHTLWSSPMKIQCICCYTIYRLLFLNLRLHRGSLPILTTSTGFVLH